MCVLAMAIPLADGMLRWVGFLCWLGKVEILGTEGKRGVTVAVKFLRNMFEFKSACAG